MRRRRRLSSGGASSGEGGGGGGSTGDELPYIWAHRGLSESAPEDSISSWQEAASRGYGLEGDFRRSSDDVLVCMHDATLDRSTTSAGNVNALTAAQLALVDNGSEWNPVGYAAERVPTLAQMIAVHSAYGVWALYENSLQTLVAGQQLAAQLVAAGVASRAVYAQFEAAPYPILAAIKAAQPTLKTQLLITAAAGTPTLATIKAANVDIITPEVNNVWLTESFCAAARALGMKVIPYTVDTIADRNTALAMVPDGIITGRPLLVLNGENPRGGSIGETWTGRSKWMPGDNWKLYNFTLPSLVNTPRPYNGQCGTDSLLATNAGMTHILQPLPAADKSYQVDTYIELRVVNGDATRWAGIYFALQQDEGITQFSPVNPGRNGHGVIIRRSGLMEIGRYTGGAVSVTTATVASTALSVGVQVPLRLTVTPTQITWKRLDTGVTVTFADATYRAGKLALHWSNIAARFGPLTMTQL